MVSFQNPLLLIQTSIVETMSTTSSPKRKIKKADEKPAEPAKKNKKATEAAEQKIKSKQEMDAQLDHIRDLLLSKSSSRLNSSKPSKKKLQGLKLAMRVT